MVGGGAADVGDVVSRVWADFPLTALFIVVGMAHFIKGTRIMIDDYFQHTARKVAIIVSVVFSWAVIAAAVFALAKMTLVTVAI